MQTLRLADHVDGIVYSADFGSKKPEKAFFKVATDRSGHASHEVLLVDDTLANVEAAAKAGWTAAHWTGPSDLPGICESAFGRTIR